ncbi:hypothetical protein COOONC_16184 [Cooperia oncophora]
MVSTRSLTWTCLLVQLVMSIACLVASMAVIAAKLQSVSIYEDKQFVRSSTGLLLAGLDMGLLSFFHYLVDNFALTHAPSGSNVS